MGTANGVTATIIGTAAGRRRVAGGSGIMPLAAVIAAALLALAPVLSVGQDAGPRQESHQHPSQNHVQRVSITSDPGADGFYTDTDNETITVRVEFTGPGQGASLFGGATGKVRLDIGGATRSATVSRHGRSRTWDLTYRVQRGDRDLDGISVPANGLSGFGCGTGCTPDGTYAAVSSTQKVLATPSAPSGFSARGGAGRATLTWNGDSGAHSSRNYQVRYRAAGENYGGWTSAGGASARSRVVTLAAGTYDFQLRARNRAGDGAVATASGVRVTAAAPPPTPTGPTAPSGTVSVVVDPTSLTVVEGRTAAYQVRLSAAPSADVRVTIASSAAAVATVAPAELTFTASDWSTQQRVTVTAVQDDDSEDGAATLTHTVSGSGADPTGPTVQVTVTDDDAAGVEVPDELTFPAEAKVPAQRYTAGTEVSVTLPAATGGTPPFRYRLTPDLPEGLSFDAKTRVLSGTPAAAAGQTEYTLTVTDAKNASTELRFSITVEASGGAAAAGAEEEASAAQETGTALTNVLAAFGGAVAADAVEVIGHRFTAVGPLLQLGAPAGPGGAPDAGAVLAGSAFAAPGPGGLALWGRGSLTGFSTATENGNVLSGYLGADWRLLPELLVGGAVTYGGAGDVNYHAAGAAANTKGKATVNLGAALPYAHWSPLPGLGVWGLLGLGGGVAAVTPAGSSTATDTGVFLALGAAGVRYDLLGWPGGSAAVKTDGLLASLSAAEQPGLAAANATPGRVRLLIDARTRWEFLEQSWLQPVLEVGGRYDGALGAEFGGGVSYRHAGLGLGADLRGRYLLAERQEWGASAALSYTLGASGWSFALNLSATREEHPAPPAYALLLQSSLRL